MQIPYSYSYSYPYSPAITRTESKPRGKTKLRCTSHKSVADLDLYELLGLESSCDQSQIKEAYRKLQKRCHPDIAGPPGHDMSILVNQVYSLLSDPVSRFAYDKKQAKMGQLRGYTGKPLYSVWLGSESEERAVFVDEIKCVGCLKCALFADKTFAIESVYGRARVVTQWADPPDQIQAAIHSCPVDCISMVQRSDLAALEFLMSKQPRENVRVGASHTAGKRVSNIFVDVHKFQAAYADSLNKASTQAAEETDLQRETRLSAVQAIRSISNWLYWKSPKPPSKSRQNVLQIAEKSTQPNINKLREAVEARKQAKPEVQTSPNEEYWKPLVGALPASDEKLESTTNSEDQFPKVRVQEKHITEDRKLQKIQWEIPMLVGMIAAINVQQQLRYEAVIKLDEHAGGLLALDIVNSSWLPVVLAGITWFFICIAVMQFAQAIQKRL